MSRNDRWNVNRFGTAARVTKVGGGIPQYGLVSDLATGTSPYLSTEQYQDMMRQFAARSANQSLANDPAAQAFQLEYQHQMERAANYQESGYAATDEDLSKGYDFGKWIGPEDAAQVAMTGMHMFTSGASTVLGDAATNIEDAAKLVPVVGGWAGALFGDDTEQEQAAATYEQYRKNGGILSRKDFESFEAPTQSYLVTHAKARKMLGDVADTPGISQLLKGLGYAYSGAQVPFIMFGNAGHTNPMLNLVDPMWYKPGSWAAAWREAHGDPNKGIPGQSFGNALVNAVAEPYVGQNRINEWKRDSAIYDLTSLGVELGATWYIDPVVIGGKVAGGASRFARYAVPLNEGKGAGLATMQALRRESITVRGPEASYGKLQASRMQSKWDDLAKFARTHSLGEFSRLRPFQHRATEGYSAAYALHWVFNNAKKSDIKLAEFANLETGEKVALNYPDMETLTKQMMVGDPKAWEDFNSLQAAAPEEIAKHSPGAQNFVKAIESMKTGLPGLQKEADDLAKLESKSPFHQWAIDREVKDRVDDIAQQEEALAKWEGYDQWRESLTREPNVKEINAQHRFFMDNQFGETHHVVRWAKPLWLQKANVASLHDMDSGAMQITRQMQQMNHFFRYSNPDAAEYYLQKFLTAKTPWEKREVLQSVELNELIPAAAAHFNVKPEVIEEIYNKIIAEQDAVKTGILRGNEPIYSTAPDAASRIEGGGENISLVNHDPETEMVTLNLMDNGVMRTIETHESALTPSGPVDPTQTVNYYTPIDTRQFYYALKRARPIIREMDHAGAREAGAQIMEWTDALGAAFNRMWKPMVLFRFGWPQRVLIDERMRALAILGIPQFTKYYGGNDIRVVNNLAVRTTDALHNRFSAVRDGSPWGLITGRQKFNIGPGPVAEEAKETSVPFLLDNIEQEVPRVPEVYLPAVDPARQEKIAQHVADWDKFHAESLRIDAWEREFTKLGDNKRSFFDLGEMDTRAEQVVAAGGDTAKAVEPNPIQQRALEGSPIYKGQLYSRPAPPSKHPIRVIYDKSHLRRDLGRKADAPGVYDPITARVEKTGLAVPLEHTRLTPANRDDLFKWYADNSELLASTGHRVMVFPDQSIAVARVLPNRMAKQAREIAEFVKADSVWNLRNGKKFTLKSWNDITPTMEAAQRQFQFEPEMQRETGEAPFEGPQRLTKEKELYHGSYARDLADRPLEPRHEAPLDNGRMMGDGFYTTTRMEIGEGYGENLFVLKGSRDGRTYRIFDLERKVSKAEQERLRGWVDENMPEYNEEIADLLHDVERGYVGGLVGEGKTWANYFAHMYGPGTKALTRYVEEVHGAGVLTHSSGNASGELSRTFIWLDPENMLIKPLWTPNGKFVPAERFFNGPDGMAFSPIPENRIWRVGKRNPMFRDLHTNHRKLVEREAELRAQGKAKLHDPEFQGLLSREQDLMDGLGLEYKSALKGVVDEKTLEAETSSPLGQDWYVMTDPEKFGRVHDEAAARNAEYEQGAQINGELRSQERAFEDADFDMELDDTHNSFLRGVWRRRESGTGHVSVKSADGEEVFYPSAYDGHRGALMKQLVSSKGAMETLSDGHGAGGTALRQRAVGMKAHNPPVMDDAARTRGTKANKEAVAYFDAWSSLVNSQIAHSPVWSKMLNGWSDAKIVRWLEGTPEGSTVLREMKHDYFDTELWVNEHRAKLNYYVPNPKVRRLLGKGPVSTSQLRREVDEGLYPDVFAPDIEFLDKRAPVSDVFHYVMDRTWNALGTMPIDTFSRHPFAHAMYDLRMRALIKQTDSKWLDEKTIARFERESRKFAKEQVRRTLWDLTDQTNFADALRFIAPFWGAQLEAIQKWARIISDRPETIGRWFALGNAINMNYPIVNEEGVRVYPGPYTYNATNRVIVRIPEVLRDSKFGKALQTLGSVGIPFGSANTVLQGEQPLMPGPGPIVTIPADKLLRHMSDTYMTEHNENFLYHWLFPIGRPQHGGTKGALEQILPGWAKRVAQMREGNDGISYSNLFTETAREMELEARRKGEKPPTEEEIKSQADWVWGLRIVAGLIAPVQMQFRPKHQFFIDQWHKYEKEYGVDAFDKFIKDYGADMARYTASSSSGFVPPTGEGMKSWSQNKDLIRKFGKDSMTGEMTWASAIIGPDAFQDDFDPDAYYAQFNIDFGPGDNTKLRSSRSQQERFAQTDARVGWNEYRRVDAIIDVELEQRGLHSIQQKGAEDLALAKKNFIADLTQRNPAWRSDYDSFNNDIYTRISELEKWAFLPRFDKRPDIQGVRQYLMIRQKVAQQLDAYAATTGGSRSLTAEDNGALREWFYTQVGALAQANPAFAEFYSRYLSGDTLEQGSGGF